MTQYPFKVETEEEKRERHVFSAIVDCPSERVKCHVFPIPGLPGLYVNSESAQTYCERKGWRWMTVDRMKEFYCEGR